MFCNKCGTEIAKGNNFCAQCGTNISTVANPILETAIDNSNSIDFEGEKLGGLAMTLFIMIAFLLPIAGIGIWAFYRKKKGKEKQAKTILNISIVVWILVVILTIMAD